MFVLQVCEELGCENQVFPLSVRILDLFLASCNTARQHLQLLGAVCLHVASKVRQVHPIATETLIYYTDNSITAMDMLVSTAII
jgi:cyclin D2